MLKGKQEYTRVNRAIQGKTGVYKGKQGYTKVNRGI